MQASHFDAAVAYASVDRHRMEDYKPYVYRTRDYGKTWTLLNQGLEAPAFSMRAGRSRAARAALCGTEFGVSVSFDDGGHWQSLQLNLPTVSVRDLEVHGDDLVIATLGADSGSWTMPAAAPDRRCGLAATALLYKPAKAIRMSPQAFIGTPFPPEEPKAKNPPEGAHFGLFFHGCAADRSDARDSGRQGRPGAPLFDGRPTRAGAQAGCGRGRLVRHHRRG